MIGLGASVAVLLPVQVAKRGQRCGRTWCDKGCATPQEAALQHHTLGTSCLEPVTQQSARQPKARSHSGPTHSGHGACRLQVQKGVPQVLRKEGPSSCTRLLPAGTLTQSPHLADGPRGPGVVVPGGAHGAAPAPVLAVLVQVAPPHSQVELRGESEDPVMLLARVQGQSTRSHRSGQRCQSSETGESSGEKALSGVALTSGTPKGLLTLGASAAKTMCRGPGVLLTLRSVKFWGRELSLHMPPTCRPATHLSLNARVCTHAAELTLEDTAQLCVKMGCVQGVRHSQTLN